MEHRATAGRIRSQGARLLRACQRDALDTLITEVEVTSARPHDSQHISNVLTGEETAIYADSAYGATEYRETLEELEIEDHILEKA